MKSLKLPKRLQAIADHIEKTASVTDVGTDHGLLPVYLAQNKLAHRIIATDISENSLKSALRTAAKYEMNGLITFETGAGLENIDETRADVIVTAGMGGETIIGVLEQAPWTKKPGIKLILQPQTKIGELCGWLYENEYTINDAELVSEKGKLYIIIIAGGGKTTVPDEPEIELMMILKKKRDPLFAAYLQEQIDRALHAAEGIANSGTPGNAENMQKKLEELVKIAR